MDSLAQIQKFVESNTEILLPVFRTSATLSSLAIISAALMGFISPATLAKQFGIPLETGTSSQKTKRGGKNESATNSSGVEDLKLAKAWIMAWAGREIFLGSLILSLLYLNELKALGIALILENVVRLWDTVATFKGGKEGAYKNHLIPTVLISWMGPLALLLHSTTS